MILRLSLTLFSLIFVLGSSAVADDASPLLDQLVNDDASVLHPEDVSRIENSIKTAEENGALMVRFMSETTMVRIAPTVRATQLAQQLAAEFTAAHPDQPLAKVIKLDTEGGARLPDEIQPLPLVFYFVRGSRDGSDVLMIGGFDALESEIGTPLATEFAAEMLQLYVEEKKKSDSPSSAVASAIENFTRNAANARAKLYQRSKDGNENSNRSGAIWVIILGSALAAGVFVLLRSIGGEKQVIKNTTDLPKFPIETRLGGRYSGGMSSTRKWGEDSDTESN